MELGAASMWDEHQAYEELLYWDSLIQRGHRLLPHDFDRYTICLHLTLIKIKIHIH